MPAAGSRGHLRLPHPSSGTFSTAQDTAAIAQLFLNSGTYGTRTVLSRALAGEALRNQIPGIPASFFGETHGEASWSYLWSIAGKDKWTRYPAFRPSVFSFMGASGTFIWGDPHDNVVGVYLSVPAHYHPPIPPSPLQEPVFNIDLFANMVAAAVVE
jgi:CubicO group peptidase (beta-lactamase class C family)